MNSKSKWCQDSEYCDGQAPDGCMTNQIFIGGLPLHTTEQDLVDYFGGELGFVSQARIMRFRDGRSRGFGFVQFGCKLDYYQALEIHTFTISGVSVQCRPSVCQTVANQEARNMQKRKLIIVGMEGFICEQSCESHFAVYGPVVRVKIFRSEHKRTLTVQGYVEFGSEHAVQNILGNKAQPRIISLKNSLLLVYSAEAKSSSTKTWKESFKAQIKSRKPKFPLFGSEKSVGLSQQTTTTQKNIMLPLSRFSGAHNATAERDGSPSLPKLDFAEGGNYRFNLSSKRHWSATASIARDQIQYISRHLQSQPVVQNRRHLGPEESIRVCPKTYTFQSRDRYTQ